MRGDILLAGFTISFCQIAVHPWFTMQMLVAKSASLNPQLMGGERPKKVASFTGAAALSRSNSEDQVAERDRERQHVLREPAQDTEDALSGTMRLRLSPRSRRKQWHPYKAATTQPAPAAVPQEPKLPTDPSIRNFPRMNPLRTYSDSTRPATTQVSGARGPMLREGGGPKHLRVSVVEDSVHQTWNTMFSPIQSSEQPPLSLPSLGRYAQKPDETSSKDKFTVLQERKVSPVQGSPPAFFPPQAGSITPNPPARASNGHKPGVSPRKSHAHLAVGSRHGDHASSGAAAGSRKQQELEKRRLAVAAMKAKRRAEEEELKNRRERERRLQLRNASAYIIQEAYRAFRERRRARFYRKFKPPLRNKK